MSVVFVNQVEDWARFPAFALKWLLQNNQVQTALEMADRLGLEQILVQVMKLCSVKGDVLWVAMLGANQLEEAGNVLRDMADSAKTKEARDCYTGLAEVSSKAMGIVSVNSSPRMR